MVKKLSDFEKERALKSERRVSDNEYGLWMRVCEDERLMQVLVEEYPETAFNFFNVFFNNRFGNEETRKVNKRSSVQLGEIFLDIYKDSPNQRGRFYGIADKLREDVERNPEFLIPDTKKVKKIESKIETPDVGNTRYCLVFTVKRIIKHLTKIGMSQGEFSREFGFNERLLYKLLHRREEHALTLRSLDIICRGLKLSMDYVVFGVGRKKTPDYLMETYPSLVCGFSKELMARRFRDVLETKSLSRYCIEKHLGVCREYVAAFAKGQKGMKLRNFAKTCNLLNFNPTKWVYGVGYKF